MGWYVNVGADRDGNGAASWETIQTSPRHYVQAVERPVRATGELRDPSDPGSTVHVEIDVSGRRNADNLGVLPRNDAGTVEAVARALGYDADRPFRLVPNGDAGGKWGNDGGGGATGHSLPIPTPCTVRECLERYCDLTGPLWRSDLKQLAAYASGDLDMRALLRMSSREGKAEYREKIVDAHGGMVDIITRLCTSISCPLEHFVMVCPRLQPRCCTISSAAAVHPTTIHITLAVLEKKTARRVGGGAGEDGAFRGLCSGHLAGLGIGDTVRAFVRESSFRLPARAESPVIMLGPGTGIAWRSAGL